MSRYGGAVFFYLLLALLVGAAIQLGIQGDRSAARVGEVGLAWILIGYCGVAMLLHALESLLLPVLMANWHGFAEGGVWQAFTTVALFGMAVSAVLSIWVRGSYRVGPTISWAIYFAGAT